MTNGKKPTEMLAPLDKMLADLEAPTGHNPRFASVIHPTLETVVEALAVASYDWLAS